MIFHQCISYFIALFLHSLPPALKMLAFHPNHEPPHLFFMLMMDYWTITSGILPHSTLTFLFKAGMFLCLHFLFHVPPKKEITWVAVRRVGGPGFPLKHLMQSILSWNMVSSHSITILAWCGMAPSCCHTIHLNLASP